MGNLENLAALNPGLYRTIVEQIQGSSHTHYEEVSSSQQTTTVTEQQQMQYQQEMQYQQQQQQEEQMYQQQLEQQQYEQQIQQQMHYEEHSSLTEQVIEESTMSEESAMLQQQQQIELERQQRQQHQKMKRLEAEAQEEVRQALTKQREAKMKAMRDAQPKQPVEISVIAGDGKQVRIQLGGDTQEDSRKQVAEAAGLKHIPLPDFDDNNAAWAGSLKKTPKSKMMPGRGEEEMDGENPWSGSLRHVKGPGKNKKHEEKEDNHGGAPWMGTLRHVVHDNK